MPSSLECDRVVRECRLDTSRDTALILDSDNRITYCNPAWDAFAINNRGARAVAAEVLGRGVLDVCAPVVRDFYQFLYQRCRETGLEASHGYHCSSPEKLRVFKMVVRPVGNVLVVRNVLLEERPHPGPLFHLNSDYLNGDLVTLCSNCRRARNLTNNEWDWVPELLHSEEFARVSHGLCRPCAEFYYGPSSARSQHA